MARGPGNQGARDPRGRAEGKRQVYQQVWPRRNGLVLSAEKLTFSKGGGATRTPAPFRVEEA